MVLPKDESEAKDLAEEARENAKKVFDVLEFDVDGYVDDEDEEDEDEDKDHKHDWKCDDSFPGQGIGVKKKCDDYDDDHKYDSKYKNYGKSEDRERARQLSTKTAWLVSPGVWDRPLRYWPGH